MASEHAPGANGAGGGGNGKGGGGGDGDGDGGEWYAGGLRFNCTQCGNCCTGPPGAVWFEPEEGRAMAAALGMDEATFLARYARRAGVRTSLKEVKIKGQYDCALLERRSDGTTGCSVYRARPTQCRTWPFWPELLESSAAWQDARQSTPCPGMDRGELIPVERIRIIRAEQAGADGRIARGGRSPEDADG